MKKLSIDLEYCYGIKKLQYVFDFTAKPTYVIYAPNGVMKTSFAKTFKDLSEGKESKDCIFTSRATKRIIVDEAGSEISSENIFVILPYEKNFHSERISTLLVNADLKAQYEEIHSDINAKKKGFINTLKKTSGLKNGIEEQISHDFIHTEKDFYRALIRIEPEINDSTNPLFSDIQYAKIFNDKVLSLFDDPSFRSNIEEYITKYNSLIESSNFFRKGVFNHYNASTIAKNLKDNGFFKANHAIYLNKGTGIEKVAVNTEEELVKIIQEEKESILNDETLKAIFNKIDKLLDGNASTREFRDILGANPTFVSELQNLEALKQKLWISYIKNGISEYTALLDIFKPGKEKLEEIILQAKNEETQWRDVIEEFNRRFSVPFKLQVQNQDDVILKDGTPNIRFIFQEKGNSVDSKSVEESELFDVLSNGELRALYLLNIIFEVEARRSSNIETIFIVDDVADSFDYKNKYAIIEYLKDITKEPNFKQIILSHNFDFYRTVSGRLDMTRSNKLHTIKTINGITLKEETYQNNPFEVWKKKFCKNNGEAQLIASIPFVRNIAEYTGDTSNFNKLTSLLHQKDNTNTLTLKNLEDIFKSVLKDQSTLNLQNGTNKVTDMIYATADSFCSDPSEYLELEGKIVLAIAIRLLAEAFIISQIADNTYHLSLSKNATFQLIKKYKEEFSTEIERIKLLEQVNLMTPENIHLNSFMYEPILDMSCHHLKELYIAIKTI